MVGVSTSCWEDFIVSAVGIMPGIDAAFPFVTILLWGPRIFIWGLDPSNPGIDTRIENSESIRWKEEILFFRYSNLDLIENLAKL